MTEIPLRDPAPGGSGPGDPAKIPVQPLDLEQNSPLTAAQTANAPSPLPPVAVAPGRRIGLSEGATRQWIGFLLIGLMALVVFYSLVALYALNQLEPRTVTDLKAHTTTVYDGNPTAFARLTSLLNILFGPIVTLVSSVTGFYFGAKTATEAPQQSGGDQTSTSR